jgi:phosphopantothenoylcysteine synthetase/decarboxylase
MNIEKLLRYIITQILNNMNKRALLFITGGSVNIKDIFETLKSFNLLQYDIVVSEDAEKVVPEEYIKNLKGNIISCKADMTKAIKEADLVIIPIMSRNTLSKCAAGISDNLVTLGISEALMMSKEIIAVKDSFDPLNPLNISLGVTKNAMYNKFILEYEERLISFGIKFLDSNDLRKAIQGKFNTLNINVLNNYDINELENKNTIQQHTLRLEEKNYYKNQPIEKVETLTSEKENIHLEN